MCEETGVGRTHRPRAAKHKTAPPAVPLSDFPKMSEQAALQLCAALGRKDPPFALALGCDTRNGMWAVFRNASDPRPSTLPKQLRKILKSARKRKFHPHHVPKGIWPFIGVEDEKGLEELCSSQAALIEAIEQALMIVDVDEEVIQSRKGGRFRDPRIDTAVAYLARIFFRYMRSRPTLTIDEGEMVSPFALFVYEAFSQFYPGPIPEGSLQLAVREAVQFERDIELMSLKEVDKLLSESRSV